MSKSIYTTKELQNETYKYHCFCATLEFTPEKDWDPIESLDFAKLQPEPVYGACSSELQPFYGKKHTEESKRLISEAHRGRKHTEEFKRKLSKAMKGKPSSFYGKKHTEESMRKMSEALKGRTAWNKGKNHTEESKRKMSEAKKGIKRGPYKKRIELL